MKKIYRKLAYLGMGIFLFGSMYSYAATPEAEQKAVQLKTIVKMLFDQSKKQREGFYFCKKSICSVGKNM